MLPADAMNELMRAAFRAHSTLSTAGDRMVADLGLTMARCHLLEALDAEGQPRTVAQIARRMGLTRQAVQRLADDSAGRGLIVYAINPDHARAKLMTMTEAGRAAHGAAMLRQRTWASELAQGLDSTWIQIAVEMLRLVSSRAAPEPPKSGSTRLSEDS